MHSISKTTRRTFLQASALGAAQLLAARTHAHDANGKLRVASVGTGGKGKSDLLSVVESPRVEVTALCNTDQSAAHFGWAVEKYPLAARYTDFRRLFDKPDSFDAVIVSTPDHMHAPVALAAMELGKHVFCEKPLTHTVTEARQMREAANRNRVTTQMGNQVQSYGVYRNAVKLVQDGAIGKVREVHSWQSSPLGWMLTETRPADSDPVPSQLNWDLWLGVAPARPYKEKLYHPFNWRAWQDFSSGQLGDFGCHIFDPIFMALDLTAPLSVQAEASPLGNEVWTRWCTVNYEFPGTKQTVADTLPVTWYDGEGRIPNPSDFDLPADHKLPGGGSILLGEAGTLVIPHVGEPRLFPDDRFADYERPVLGDVNHYTSWADACLGDGQTTSNFDYAAPLTEAVLLGVVASRFPGEALKWDPAAGQITNHNAANARLTKSYRTGW